MASVPLPPVEGENPLDAFEKATREVPLFMNQVPDNPDHNPTLAALQSLIYDDTPESIAENFKTQGNDAFKAGKVRFKDAVEFYTKGLAAKCKDDKLNVLLLVNRAAVNLELGNYRSVKEDCVAALKLDPKQIKAYFRYTRAHFMLEQYDEALKICNTGLEHYPTNGPLLEEQKKILTALERKRTIEEAKRRKAEEARQKELQLEQAIKAAGVNLIESKKNNKEDDNQYPTPSLGEHKVYLDANGRLHWPVLFLYPESKQTDIIGDFCEDDAFQDHFDVMFEYASPNGKGLPAAPWDCERKYEPTSLEVYFEVKRKDGSVALARIGSQATLSKALAHPQFTVHDRLPAFLVICKNTLFYSSFLDQYKK